MNPIEIQSMASVKNDCLRTYVCIYIYVSAMCSNNNFNVFIKAGLNCCRQCIIPLTATPHSKKPQQRLTAISRRMSKILSRE